MNKGAIWTIILIILLAIIVFAVTVGGKDDDKDAMMKDEVMTDESKDTTTATSTDDTMMASTTMKGEVTVGHMADEVIINYTDAGFSPKDVTIKVGQSVKFTNNSTRDFWPASNDHPSHLKYSEFDPKERVASGESYTFKFEKVGVWAYHNHIRAGEGGVITVK